MPSGSLLTQTASPPAATRSGADPIAIGAETWARRSPLKRSERQQDQRARSPPRWPRARRAGGQPLRPAPVRRQRPRRPLGAAAVVAGLGREDPRRRQSRPLALARRRDQGAGAGVALGRVLGDGALDHRVQPRRHLRLGVGLLAGEGRDPGQRLEEDAAERVDVGGGTDRAAAPLLRRHVLGGADHRGAALRRRSSPSALARPKSVRKARSPSTRTLCGLTSRWTMPAAWAASSASAIWPAGRSPAPAPAAPRGRSAAAGRRPRPAASPRSARRRPRASRRSAPPPGGRGWRRAATRAGSARGSPRDRPARGRSPSAPPAVRARGGWRGRRRPSRPGRSARRSGSRRRRADVEVCHPAVIPPPIGLDARRR